MKKRMFLVDGSAVIYRSYFALLKAPLINSKGINTSAVFGFTQFLLRLIKEENPEYILVAFDSHEPTFRHGLYQDYKATREKMPEDLVAQLHYIDRICQGLSLKCLRMPGFEADDIIATLTRSGKAEGLKVFIVSNDKDFAQLVDEDVVLFNYDTNRAVKITDRSVVIEKFGTAPETMLDYLSVVGDDSDNVPGVKGIGPKKALKYLDTYGSLDGILSHLDSIEGKDGEYFSIGHKMAILSRELIRLKDEIALPLTIEDCRTVPFEKALLGPLFDELEFISFKRELIAGSSPKSSYRTVVDRDSFDKLFQQLKSRDFFVFDTETTSLDPLEARLVGMSFCWQEGLAWYLPFTETDAPVPPSEMIERLKELFADPTIAKGAQNAKYDLHILANYDIAVKNLRFDTMIAAFLVNPTLPQKNLDYLAMQYLNRSKIATEQLIGKTAKTMEEVPLEQLSEYACEDAEVTFCLYLRFRPILAEKGLETLFYEVEIPLIPVLMTMERAGVFIDIERLAQLSSEFELRLNELEKEIHQLAGEPFNINSPKQLSVILFEKLKIHQQLNRRIRKTKTGYSTDLEVLQDLAGHPLPEKILEYRSLAKLKNGYIDTLPKLVKDRTGKVHTHFNQAITATGRLSSTDPNLQNIPIRSNEGRKIRECFISKSGYRLISADYSQIELRMLAHLSAEPKLIKALTADLDIHASTAATIFSVDLAFVTREMRNQAKTINFGILYGMGPQRLAKENGIGQDEAKRFIESYFSAYPGIRKYLDKQISDARLNGHVRTILGRLRPLPELNNPQPHLKTNAERIATNTPIQGSAADLIKIAMINIDRRIHEMNLDLKMLLQVHDELVFEAKIDDCPTAVAMIKKEMEAAMVLTVPLKVETGIGENWLEAH